METDGQYKENSSSKDRDEELSEMVKMNDISEDAESESASSLSSTENKDLENIIALQERQAVKPRNPEQLEKARRRQELYFRSRREKKKRKIIYNRLRIFLKITFSIVLIVGLYFIATLSYWNFMEKEFTLYGNHLLTRQHIARFLHPLDGKPIYLIDPYQLQEDIRKEVPLVDKIYIRRHLFPVGLDIALAEKPSWGIVYPIPPVETELSAEEKQIKPDDLPETTEVEAVKPPFVAPEPVYLLHWDNTISDLANYQLEDNKLKKLGSPVPIVLSSNSSRIEPAILNRYREIARFLDSQPDKAKLLFLDISNPYDIYACFEGFKVRIGRADNLVIKRISRFFSLVPAIMDHKERLQWVDLRWDKQITFKKKPVVTNLYPF